MVLRSDGNALTEARFAPPCADVPCPLLRRAARELSEYFQGLRREFDLPLAPAGTPFQQKVWAALRDIPFGETRSYRQIAAAVGNPAACRAVGMANSRNPIAVIIPCHRVIGADGSLTGYAGGLDKKRHLLALEQK
jgi:methylated-DNA-[protein]-cysteine S-methyltransferase